MAQYTFDLVGLNEQITVEAKDRRSATQLAWSKLSKYEQEEVEWYDLIHVEGEEPKLEITNDLWICSAAPFYAFVGWIKKVFKK